jgi:serine/threonine-protein kinase
VFVSEGQDGIDRLFTRRLDQARAAEMPHTEGAYEPFFSPDSQWVGFFARGKLKKTRIDGGEPVPLCDASNGRGASWGEDSNIIAALDPEAGLSQVPSGGGNPVPITELSTGEDSHRWPQVLPGGKFVLFTISTVSINFDEAGIAILSLKDRRRKTVLDHAGMYPRYLATGHLVYVTKGTVVAAPFDLNRLEVTGTDMRLEEVAYNTRADLRRSTFQPGGIFAFRTPRRCFRRMAGCLRLFAGRHHFLPLFPVKHVGRISPLRACCNDFRAETCSLGNERVASHGVIRHHDPLILGAVE